MKRVLRWALGILVGLFVLSQAFRPERSNPPVNPAWTLLGDTTVPRQVADILHRSCFDCHSNETRWPWYSNFSPVNFLLVRDVRRGRKMVNFSEWGKYKPGRKYSIFDEIHDQISHNEMPLGQYLLMHPNARLSEEEKKLLLEWADAGQKQSDDQEPQ